MFIEMYMLFCYVKFHSRLFWIDKYFMSIYEHWFKIRTFQSHISFMQIKFLLQLSFFDFIYELNHYRVIKHHDVDISPTLIHAFFCSLTSISRSFHKFHNNIFFFFLHITIMSTTKRFFVIRMCFHFTINDINVNEYVINENDLQLMINISQIKTFFFHETTKLTRFQLRFRFFFSSIIRFRNWVTITSFNYFVRIVSSLTLFIRKNCKLSSFK